MRILIVNDFQDEVGGAEIYDNNLCKLLNENGHEAKVVGGDSEEDRYTKYISRFYSLKWKRIIRNKIREFEPDVIFCHKIVKNVSPSFLTLEEVADIAIILKPSSVHQYKYNKRLSFEAIFHDVRKVLHRPVIRKNVDKLVCPSKYLAEEIKKDLDIDEVRIIHNPSLIERENSIDNSKKDKIVFVGRISKGKGLKTLLHAHSVSENSSELDIVGSGPLLEKMKEISSNLGIKNKVNFKGKISHDRVKKVYRQSKITLMPSKIPETFGLVIPESYSQGTPVITTNIGGQKELVEDGETGFLIEPEKSEDLADKIEKIMEEPELREKMSRNTLDYAKKFSSERHIQEVEELFEEVINENSSD